FTETTSPGEVRVSGQPVQGLVLRLSPSLSITGRLLGVDPDELMGARIQAFFQGPAPRFRWLFGVMDGQGKYRVPDAFPGTWQVKALLPDGRSAEGTLEVTTEPAVLDLEIAAGLTLSGRVLVDGEPLAGATLSVDGSQTSTAYDGG